MAINDPGNPVTTASPEGRRILVAVVTGEAGERLAAWRRAHDPQQANRLPPHTTLCYWLPPVEGDALAAQVRRAFPRPVTVALGPVAEFDNDEHTFYVPVREAAALDRARERLYDGAHAALGPWTPWPWHITCVRDSRGRDLAALRAASADLDALPPWTVDEVAAMELRGAVYVTVARFTISPED